MLTNISRESMTCISGLNRESPGMKTVVAIFDSLGVTLVVDEEKVNFFLTSSYVQMIPATALCACGIAVRDFRFPCNLPSSSVEL